MMIEMSLKNYFISLDRKTPTTIVSSQKDINIKKNEKTYLLYSCFLFVGWLLSSVDDGEK